MKISAERSAAPLQRCRQSRYVNGAPIAHAAALAYAAFAVVANAGLNKTPSGKRRGKPLSPPPYRYWLNQMFVAAITPAAADAMRCPVY